MVVIDRFVGTDTTRSGGMLLIRGPAGIGKTRLLAAVAARGAERGLAVHSARAGELEGDLAWGVVRQLFSPVLTGFRAGDDPVLSGAARLARPALGLGDEPVGADSLSAALHGLYWLAADLSERRPLLLAVDDVQWADPASARWLQYLAKRVADVPVLLAVTVRPGDPRAGERATALQDADNPVVLDPRPLTAGASAQVIAATNGREPDREFLQACWRATGGNPFLLTELARQLTADHVDPVAAQAGRVAEMTPEAVARSVLRRLAALPGDAGVVAHTVAVLGGGADVRLVAALAGLDEARTAEAADALAAAELLRGGEPLDFVHPLVGAAVHDAIPPLARQTAHAGAARALAGRGASPDAIAPQLVQSSAIGEPWAVDTLLSAALSARGRGAPEEATAYLRRALLEEPRGDRRAAVLLELGAVEAELGGREALARLSEAYDLAADPALRAAATLALAGALVIADGHREAIQRLETTLGDVAGSSRELDLQLGAALTSAGWYLSGEQRDAARFAAPVDVQEGATLGERIMLAALAADSLFAAREPATVAVGLIERALAGRGFLQDLGPEFISFWQAMYLLHAADAVEMADRHERQAFDVARARGSATALWMTATYQAELHLLRGQLPDAEAQVDHALTFDAPWPFFRLILAHISIRTLIEQGRLTEADAVAVELGDFPSGKQLSLNDLFPLCSRGHLRLAQHRPADALADFRRVARDAPTTNPAVYPWRSGAATALAALGRRDEAWELVEEELATARVFGVARPIGIALRAMGTIAGPRDGLELLRESVEALEGCPSPLERAHSQLELGSALRRTGRRAEAVPLLREALDAAERSAAAPLAQRARRELVDAGSRPHRPARLGRDVLTPTELQVARLAAEGHANKAIAQTLFVSLRTVETHLTHAYAKLCITARRQLPDALATGVEADAA